MMLPPRSAREVLEFATDLKCEKYKELPCRTFISIGSCPYKSRCEFLHDKRLEAAGMSRHHRFAQQKKNKEQGKKIPIAKKWCCKKIVGSLF